MPELCVSFPAILSTSRRVLRREPAGVAAIARRQRHQPRQTRDDLPIRAILYAKKSAAERRAEQEEELLTAAQRPELLALPTDRLEIHG